MLIVKPGVRLYGLQPEMLWALDRCTDVFEAHGADCIVTSARGEQHKPYSLHYAGHAVDLRRRHVTGKADGIRQALQSELGPDFQVLLEKTHFHVEFQPQEQLAYWSRRPG